MTDRSQNQRWLFRLAFGLSLAVHVGVAAHLLSRAPEDFGAINRTTNAVSVNVEATEVLDATEQSEAKEAANAPAAPPGEMIPAPNPVPEKTEESPVKTETEKAEAEPPPPPAATAEQQAAEEAKTREEEALRQAKLVEQEKQEAERRAREKASKLVEEQERAEREAEARETAKDKRADAAKQAKRQAKEKRAQAGANAGASGSADAKASKGRVSASQGDVRTYAGILNSWIARNKPGSAGGRGTTVIILAMSPSGALISASISSSSGNPALDQLALATVRRSSPFPKPPAGLSANQLRFTFPCKFH
jgi:protein TonB